MIRRAQVVATLATMALMLAGMLVPGPAPASAQAAAPSFVLAG